MKHVVNATSVSGWLASNTNASHRDEEIELAGVEPPPHPTWCLGTEKHGESHRSETLTVTATLCLIGIQVWRSQRIDARCPIVMLAIEEPDVQRSVWPLEHHQAQALARVLDQLEQSYAHSLPLTDTPAGPETATTAHPRWCVGTEKHGQNHRSEKLAASGPLDLIGISAWLSGRPPDEFGPGTSHALLHISDDFNSHLWPMHPHELALVKHALIQELSDHEGCPAASSGETSG